MAKTKVYVAGHNGMVGSSLTKYLKKKGFNKLIFADKKKIDLTNEPNHLKKSNRIFI